MISHHLRIYYYLYTQQLKSRIQQNQIHYSRLLMRMLSVQLKYTCLMCTIHFNVEMFVILVIKELLKYDHFLNLCNDENSDIKL